MKRRTLLQLGAALPLLACSKAGDDPLVATMEKIRPLFRPKSPPQPGDWLGEHPEPGQSYRQFRETVTARAVDAYKTLRIVPIGPLSAGQSFVFDVVKEFLAPFFGLQLAIDSPVALDSIPDSARRVQTLEGVAQLLTTYLLNDTLMKHRQPGDAAVLGLTASDLWPGPGWNFVFGQASLKERVGVWSMARNGDPDIGDVDRNMCALRTVMTATHETGHMFGIAHCIHYHCLMNGSNHLEETDAQPLHLCPVCLRKLQWSVGFNVLQRYRDLHRITKDAGLAAEAKFLELQIQSLTESEAGKGAGEKR